jgi:hypothetical protein
MSVDIFAKRSQMTPLSRGVRAYVAPVDRKNGVCVAFDPAAQGQFDLDNPPNPFLDLGWVQNFTRKSTTKYEGLRNGPHATVSTQYRSQPESLVEFDFESWGKVQMALAGGTQEMNVLAIPRTSLPQSSGGVAIPASYVLDGSSDYRIFLDPGEMSKYAIGDIVAVDFDYTGTTGYIGSGAPAAYLTTAVDPATHQDYTRRVTFNLSRVETKTANQLSLASRLIASAQTGMGVQKAVAFVDREGGSFFQEWSGLFVIPSDTGGRICIYYPRLQPGQSNGEQTREWAAPFFNTMSHVSLRALPTTDSNDGETVLCYRSYFPTEYAAAY